MNTTLLICFALGLRHGTDPDHLTAIDGLCRLRPRATNGLYFALGHGLVVTLLAIGFGTALARYFSFAGPWVLILIGCFNLWKLCWGKEKLRPIKKPIVSQPFLLGMLLAAGFETSSQLSALLLADRTNPVFLGAAFCAGMIFVDGIDGYLATSLQNLAAEGVGRALIASKTLGILVVIFSFGLGGAELLGFELDQFALPTGLSLFAMVVTVRIWARLGNKREGGADARAYESW